MLRDMTTKRCTRCGQTKAFSEYGDHPRGKHGKQAACYKCYAKANSLRYWADHDKWREVSRLAAAEYRRKYPARKKASHDRWVRDNPEKDKAAKRRHYKANKATYRAKAKALYYASPEYREMNKAWTRAYRARQRGNGGLHSPSDLRAIFNRQAGRCPYCKEELVRYHVDHIHPLSRGGSNAPGNLQLLCGYCNRSKGSRTHEEHRAYLREIS